MRRTFQKWLFAFVSMAFVVTLGISVGVQTAIARDNARALIALRMQDAETLITHNNDKLSAIREMTDAAALSKARAFAALLWADPTMAADSARLKALLATLDVDQLHVIDGAGVITASTVPAYIAYAMDSRPQSAFFMPLLKDAALELVQDPQEIGYDSETVMQFAGVARRDAAGFVQIGYVPQRLAEAMEIADIENLAPGFRIGNSGRIVVCENGIIVSVDDAEYLGASISHYGLDPRVLLSEDTFIASVRGERCMGQVKACGNYAILGLLPLREIYLSRQNMVSILIACNVVLFLVVFALVSYLVKRVVIDGINEVNASLSRITAGDLEERVTVRTNPEFRALSDGINSMVNALKQLIAEAKARIDAELDFARTIQTSALPSRFPPYPDHPEFDIYAAMFPAREVGGDFYDIFLVRGNVLCVVIADVSGKGVPAAMFMMQARTSIKDSILAGLKNSEGSLAGIVADVNNGLCENNEADMFLTAFIGLLDLSNNEFTYVNAGHNLPLLRRAGGAYAWLSANKPDFVLGGMENRRYTAAKTGLQPGDELLLYTDGVTEAMDREENLYSSARLCERMNAADMRGLSPRAQIELLYQDVQAFAGGAPQADDITMLSLHSTGQAAKA